MDVFPKFIIETDQEEGDCLIVAKCTYHRQLVTDKEKVKGGGWWLLNYEQKLFTLHGSSEDFGQARIEDIADCVQRGKVYSSAALTRDFIEQGYKFQYKNECGEIFDLHTFKNNQDADSN